MRLGRVWRRIHLDAVTRLLPGLHRARIPLVVIAGALMVLLGTIGTILLVTDRSWRYWRLHEAAHTWLSPYFAPWGAWYEIGSTTLLGHLAVLLAARVGVNGGVQWGMVAIMAYSARGMWYASPAILAVAYAVQHLALRLNPAMWLRPVGSFRRRPANAYSQFMRRRMQPWFVVGLTTLVLALSMVGDGNTIGFAALSGTYALMTVSAVELRSAWLVPGAARRGGIGDALFRIWFTDCARTTLLALLLVTVAVLLLSGITATHGQAWWQDADAAMTLRRRLWSAAAATTAMLGVAWTGLRIMTASPRYLTSGPASMGSGQWIVLAVALAIPLLQLVLGTRDWPGLNRDWCRSVECTAVFSALFGPVIAALIAKAKRREWEIANLAAVADTLDRMAKYSERNRQSWWPSGSGREPRMQRD